MSAISFEEIMFTIMSATQDTFKSYMGTEVFAGHVEKKVEPVDSDVVGIVGIAGDRVGYILFATDMDSARHIAMDMLMLEEADDESIRDTIGELANNIAGAFKTRYHQQYGSVALGLPLIVSGKLRPVSDDDSSASMNVACKGVTIPFKSEDGRLNFRVMVYMG